MPRKPLPLGAWGEIRVYPGRYNDDGKPTAHKANANYRDFDGRTRRVERWGKTPAAARSNLRTALTERATLAQQGELSASTRFREAADLWMTRFQELVDKEARSPASAETYQRHLKNHVNPAVGDLRLVEMTTPLLDRFIRRIAAETGSPTAKSCRSILSGVLGLAVRYGAIVANPVREVDRVEGKTQREPRALTHDERVAWLAQLDADKTAIARDLPDLCRFMLATGVRIGEALAVQWRDVDLRDHTVMISSTVIRVTGVGLVRKRTKTRAGERKLRLPRWAVVMLQQRFLARPRFDEPVFPDSRDGLRDPSNTRRELREARGSEGFAWVTSHNFRKTAATILDDAGLSAREVADQLGHARPSMTQDVYFGRKVMSGRAAAALEGVLDSESEPNSVSKV